MLTLRQSEVELDPCRAVAVDIIILDWNRADQTILAVKSALAQRGVARRVWVVDQGSEPANQDQLAAFCDAHSDVNVHWLDRNVGVAAGRNLATQLGAAAYVVSLDNDAVFADEWCVARAIERMEREPQLGALAFRILDAETHSDEAFWDYPSQLRECELPRFAVTRFLGGGHVVRRSAFEAAGRYDERLFFGGEERDIAWRMIGLGYRLRLERDLIVVHRSVATSKIAWSGKRFYYLARNTLYINHKFGGGWLGFARGAAGFMLRGLRCGLLPAAVGGVLHGLWMGLRFSLHERDKSMYQLNEQARRYIAETDQKQAESWRVKLKRAWSPLPPV
ncbi:MAG TPA: glycosyltransferase [Polyangiales bacterium]|nr:glycosyltransferase [Polyangiales bacterium]